MKKEYPAEVICQFTRNGKILPIKFRVEDEGYREFKILSYQEKYRHLEYRQGFMTDYQVVSEIDYECRVCMGEENRYVSLRFYMRELRWTVKFP